MNKIEYWAFVTGFQFSVTIIFFIRQSHPLYLFLAGILLGFDAGKLYLSYHDYRRKRKDS